MKTSLPTAMDQLVRLYGLVLGAGLLLEGGILLLLSRLPVSMPALPIALAIGDARHNALHLVWGIVFLVLLLTIRSRRSAALLVLIFGVFYTTLGFAGVIFDNPFGLLLGPGENAFHFTVGLLALTLGAASLLTSIAFLPTRRSSARTMR